MEKVAKAAEQAEMEEVEEHIIEMLAQEPRHKSELPSIFRGGRRSNVSTHRDEMDLLFGDDSGLY